MVALEVVEDIKMATMQVDIIEFLLYFFVLKL